MLTVGNGVHYYGVDHRPSYLRNSATWEDSEALIPFLRPVLNGPIAWDADQSHSTCDRNLGSRYPEPGEFLAFQNRSAEYPHPTQCGRSRGNPHVGADDRRRGDPGRGGALRARGP